MYASARHKVTASSFSYVSSISMLCLQKASAHAAKLMHDACMQFGCWQRSGTIFQTSDAES